MLSLAVVAALGLLAPAVAAASVPPSPKLPDLVTAADALTLFRERGLDLLLADVAVEAAHADELSAAAIPNPVVGASIGKTFNYNPTPPCDGCSDIAWSVGVGDQSALFDTVWGKRHLRRSIAAAAFRAAKMTRVDAQRTLEFQLKQQYLQAVLARDSLDFAHVAQGAAQQILELNQIRYRAGAISEADVAKVETAKLETDQDVDRAEQDLATAKAQLAYMLGVRGPIPDFKVEQDLPKFAVPPALAQATRDSLLDAAYQHRADLKAAGLSRERAELSVRGARRQLLPDIALSAQFAAEGYATSAISPPTLTFGLSVPVPLFYHYRGEVARAEADLKTQSLQRAKVEAQLVSDVEAGFRTFEQTRKRVERMESRLLDRAKRTRDLIQLQYQKGAASLLELVDAERTYVSTNFEYLKDLADYWTAVFQLEQAVGMELR
jgi:cobalt-zinc-cadmium efflux system outer membrane protein